MKHTKGGWSVRGNKIFIGDTYNSICTVHIQNSWNERFQPIEDKEAIANAKLIAASPELLAACVKALKEIQDPARDGTLAENDLINAIKKATE
jgi:hypothetical protein